ncbi:hypothetical protein AArcCO_0829 [Halalkaliarchaeum sp. AArc-CO]|uniref:hypothetical protein n=1 Tax=Halalkaliarchaeum sp. AArc-CO TaxID=2866381 RepID=UPI00217F0E7A|nr:hypothetical protein [Halalkaliarchaeum sp. AArc-CO]UWG50147.1 hypothetical protein AArcCO_0829 [Halalkaliarchaeum sp. AArc-CO]
MGSASTGSSGASSIGYTDAKKGMNQALESDKTQMAVDIAVTGALAVQPNGPAKVTTYAYLKHTNTFIQTTSQEGIEAGIQATGKSMVKGEIANQVSGGIVHTSQQAVSAASENETVARGVDEVNNNFGTPSEEAAKATLGSVISNGADAMMTGGSKDDE